MRWLKRWLGYDAEPLEQIAGGLGDPEAEMWSEMLRNEGIPAVIKSSSPLVGYFATRTLSYFALHVSASDAARARNILAPVLKTRADPGRQARYFRRQRKRK